MHVIRWENKYFSQILKPYIYNLHFYINRNYIDSNFETMAELSSDCEAKKLQEFIENVANVNTKKIMKNFMWPTVRTTWAEGKRICLDILSFEAKEIDVNLKKFLSQKEWRLGL